MPKFEFSSKDLAFEGQRASVAKRDERAFVDDTFDNSAKREADLEKLTRKPAPAANDAEDPGKARAEAWQAEIDKLQSAVDQARADLASAKLSFPLDQYSKWMALKKLIGTAGPDDPQLPLMKAQLMELPNDEVMTQGAEMLKSKKDSLTAAEAALAGAQKQKDFAEGKLAA